MRTTAITTWSFDVLSLCSHSSITFSRLCNHTHNHNNMFSLHTTRACALFFVQIFPSLFFYAIAVFWSLKEKRERESRRKEICVQITQIFYEWTHRGEKGKKLVILIHSSFSLLVHYFYRLSWVLVLQKKYIYNCDRLAHTGRNIFFLSLYVFFLLLTIFLRERSLLLFCSNDEQEKGSPFVS
jgi:hypothetical protein